MQTRNSFPVGQMNAMFGGSLGQRVSANSSAGSSLQRVDEPANASAEMESSQTAKAAAVGASGNIAFSWVAMAIMFGVVMLAGQKLGSSEGNFGSIKLSAYNVVMITMVVLVGVPMAKALVAKFPIPGVSAIVLSV